MPNTLVDIQTIADGSLVVRPHGMVGTDCGTALRQVLVNVIRRIRPQHLIIDLRDVSVLDPITVGTLAAACDVADDHVVVSFNTPSAAITNHLAAAGVPRHRLQQDPTPR